MSDAVTLSEWNRVQEALSDIMQTEDRPHTAALRVVTAIGMGLRGVGVADLHSEEISIEEHEITLLQIVVVLITETAEKAATSRRSLPSAGEDHLTENMREDGRRESLIEGREAGEEVGEEDIAEVGGMSGVVVGEGGEVADRVVADGLLLLLALLGQTSSEGLYRPEGMKDLQVRIW